MIGERLGDWIIDSAVRKNEMGQLFRARAAEDSNRLAAIKWLVHPKAQSPEFERLFLAQIELIRKLKHPAIVAVLDSGVHRGTAYFVMEWVEGSDFETILRGGEKIAWQEVLTIALQILPALRFAHRRSVLHRDLKPSNLFRCADGFCKLADFGVTKFFGDALLTNADNILGSPAYLSPEQAAGRQHTKRSDFYSLGCLLYTLIVGRPPFTGNTVVELIHKHCFVLPERPIHFVRDLPEEIDRFIMKLLAKEPSQRPGSGTILIQGLEGIWSALERRGSVGKRPAFPGPLEHDNDLPAEEEPAFAPIAPDLIPREPVPWQNRWYIVVPAFAACVLLLVWAFFWRGPSADELMEKARPLLDSHNPADWDKAWADYLEPLSRRYPEKYVDEVKEARQRIDLQGELRRALITGNSMKYQSEAQRFYTEGLRLAQAGESASARKVWENLIRAYSPIKDEERWVALAAEALSKLDQRDSGPGRPSATADFSKLVEPVIREVSRLRASGKVMEADELARALEFLYRDDPAIELLRKLLSPKAPVR